MSTHFQISDQSVKTWNENSCLFWTHATLLHDGTESHYSIFKFHRIYGWKHQVKAISKTHPSDWSLIDLARCRSTCAANKYWVKFKSNNIQIRLNKTSFGALVKSKFKKQFVKIRRGIVFFISCPLLQTCSCANVCHNFVPPAARPSTPPMTMPRFFPFSLGSRHHRRQTHHHPRHHPGGWARWITGRGKTSPDWKVSIGLLGDKYSVRFSGTPNDGTLSHIIPIPLS